MFTTTIIASAIVLTLLGTDVRAQPAPASSRVSAANQSGTRPSGLRCSGTTCAYYFSRVRTASIKTRLEGTEWTTQAVAQLICVGVPNKIIAAACLMSFSYLYDKARTHLIDAYDQRGCLVLRVRLSFRKAITFSSVPPADDNCR
ncbi:hypothetical protein AB0F17_24400 [Nonomuraea sp. NPDC026600]|uniref:hypothetical protein n=1 Tax=Nonomuraea sp. NPDC026600 TaxID=3155363 RepID=UPI00340C3CA0